LVNAYDNSNASLDVLNSKFDELQQNPQVTTNERKLILAQFMKFDDGYV
jgi:hypothetical protein